MTACHNTQKGAASQRTPKSTPVSRPRTPGWQPVIHRHVSFLLRAAKWHSRRSESAKLCLITLKSAWYLRRGALMTGCAGLRGILSRPLERALIYSLKLSIFSTRDRQGNGKQLRPVANCLNVSPFRRTFIWRSCILSLGYLTFTFDCQLSEREDGWKTYILCVQLGKVDLYYEETNFS